MQYDTRNKIKEKDGEVDRNELASFNCYLLTEFNNNIWKGENMKEDGKAIIGMFCRDYCPDMSQTAREEFLALLIDLETEKKASFFAIRACAERNKDILMGKIGKRKRFMTASFGSKIIDDINTYHQNILGAIKKEWEKYE